MKKNEVREKLEQFFVDREGDGIVPELDQIDLVDAGILDSLDMVTLAVYIEREFGVKLSLADEDILEKLRRFNSIVELVSEHAAR